MLVTTGLGFLSKKFWSLYQAEKNHQKTEEQKAFYQGLQNSITTVLNKSMEADKALQSEISLLQTGLLNIQAKMFKAECRDIINSDREITLEEYESIQRDHEVYNSLGGNSDGDMLFKLVAEKFSSNMTK